MIYSTLLSYEEKVSEIWLIPGNDTSLAHFSIQWLFCGYPILIVFVAYILWWVCEVLYQQGSFDLPLYTANATAAHCL